MKYLYRVLRGFGLFAVAIIIVGTLWLFILGPYILAISLHNLHLLWLYTIHGVAILYVVGCE